MQTNEKKGLRKELKRLLMRLSKRNSAFQFFYKKALYSTRKFRHWLFAYRFPIDSKMIVFESFFGRSYADSPKAIYLEMKEDARFNDFTFVWAFKKPETFANEETLKDAVLIKRNSRRYFRHLSQAKYWVFNSRVQNFISKKKGQIHLQTWHGTPFKKLGLDIETVDNANLSARELRKAYRTEEKKFDFILSPSRYCSEHLASAFGIQNREKKILELGYPRNDALHRVCSKNIEAIKKQLGIPVEKKIILYAPTWRDNEHSSIGHTLTPPIDYSSLAQDLGEDFVFLVRYHSFVRSKIGETCAVQNFVWDVSNYSDINDLLMISDVLITDYSSTFFDYAILGRPIIFFMYDLESYMNNLRGFYLELSDLPGPILTEAKEIAPTIQTLFQTEVSRINQKHRQDFISKFCYLDDGLASKRVVQKLFE